MSPLRRLFVGLALCLLALATAVPAHAGTASASGPSVTFGDPAGAPDKLTVTIKSVPADGDVDSIEGWRVGFLQYDPATTPGPGCREGFVATVCPIGAVPPVTAVDSGGGADEVDVRTEPAFAGQKTTIQAGAGDDTVTKYQTTATIDGGPGDDLIRPDDRSSILDSPPEPTPGDVIRGGAGTDTVGYDGALDPIDVSLDGKADDGRKGERDDVGPDVENITGSQFGGTLSGSPRANVITGGGEADRITGGAGRDALDGRGGDDVIDALDGAGGDRVTCSDGADVAYVDAGDIVASQDVQGGTPCERVVTAPAVTSRARLTVTGGRVAVRLRCPRTATAACRGTLRLTTPGGKRLASKGYAARRGKRTTVRLKVKPAARAVLLVAPKGTNPSAGRAVSLR